MKNGIRQSMAWLHAWAGLVVGWVLFAVFATGTASCYRSEISQWMRPELHRQAELAPAELARAAEIGVAYLRDHAAHARSWFVRLPRPGTPGLDVSWRTRPGEPQGRALLDAKTGMPLAVRDTRGGDFLYRFHFELHMAPLWGRWIVGICAMIMLVALLSGIVTHRRIFTDFFTMRRDKSAQRGWLDAHTVAGVVALPFHLMITYTGLVTLSLMYMPWGVTTAYRGQAPRFQAETGQNTAQRPRADRPAEMAPVGPMVREALATSPQTLERITVTNPGDAAATVVALFEEPHGLSHRHPQIAFDGPTGAVIATTGALKPAARTFTAMVGLHQAHFAGPALRVLYFLCGLTGCAMVASGLVLWSVARLPKPGERSLPGLRLVQALNVGTVAGLPGAIAAYFLANRLIPGGLAGRAEWEIRVFFATWLVMALVPLALRERQAWRSGLSSASVLFLAVPVVDALATGRQPATSWWSGNAVFLGFDAAMLGLAAVLAFAAYKLARYESRRRAVSRTVPPRTGPPIPAG